MVWLSGVSVVAFWKTIFGVPNVKYTTVHIYDQIFHSDTSGNLDKCQYAAHCVTITKNFYYKKVPLGAQKSIGVSNRLLTMSQKLYWYWSYWEIDCSIYIPCLVLPPVHHHPGPGQPHRELLQPRHRGHGTCSLEDNSTPQSGHQDLWHRDEPRWRGMIFFCIIITIN